MEQEVSDVQEARPPPCPDPPPVCQLHWAAPRGEEGTPTHQAQSRRMRAPSLCCLSPLQRKGLKHLSVCLPRRGNGASGR